MKLRKFEKVYTRLGRQNEVRKEVKRNIVIDKRDEREKRKSR